MRKSLALFLTCGVLIAFPIVAQDAAKDLQKAALKVSSYAPVKAAEKQLAYFVGKIEKDLASKEEFGDGQQTRVGLNASTVSVLALSLGMHDEDTPLKASATKLIELATELADNSDDFEAATEHFAALKNAIEAKPKSDPATWDEPVADLAMLMQQVPIVNNDIRRGVTDKRRFARNAARTAEKVVTLAALAQASLIDTNYCSDESEEQEWQKICADMRIACGEVYQALMAKDQAKAKAGNAKVVAACDACHEKFRD